MSMLSSNDQARRTLREQVRVNETSGYSPLRARLAVLDVIRVRAAQEAEYLWQKFRGRLRERKLAACREYWSESWSTLKHFLDSGMEEEAASLIDGNIERLEPGS